MLFNSLPNETPPQIAETQVGYPVEKTDVRAESAMPNTLDETDLPGNQSPNDSGSVDDEKGLKELEGRLAGVFLEQEIRNTLGPDDVILLRAMLNDPQDFKTWARVCKALCILESSTDTVLLLQEYISRFEDFRETKNENILLGKAMAPIFLGHMEDKELALTHLEKLATHEGAKDALKGWDAAELEGAGLGLDLDLFLLLIRRGAYYGLARVNTDAAQQALNLEYAKFRNKFIDEGGLSDYELRASYAVCEALGEFNGIRELGRDEYLEVDPIVWTRDRVS